MNVVDLFLGRVLAEDASVIGSIRLVFTPGGSRQISQYVHKFPFDVRPGSGGSTPEAEGRVNDSPHKYISIGKICRAYVSLCKRSNVDKVYLSLSISM